ncbi:MAG: hypothetical protein BWX47_01619 [candidate division Hyd24-12 bacterium ADurb.Bin004]|nr:MAG: hypothetical protein BWX47_01619 [candidate division Hyd24-12 bacterium ADurb.Bin004]
MKTTPFIFAASPRLLTSLSRLQQAITVPCLSKSDAALITADGLRSPRMETVSTRTPPPATALSWRELPGLQTSTTSWPLD